VAEFYSASGGTIPPLPWQTFPPPFSHIAAMPQAGAAESQVAAHYMCRVLTDAFSQLYPAMLTQLSKFGKTLAHRALGDFCLAWTCGSV
jgi:hypothetical protein